MAAIDLGAGADLSTTSRRESSSTSASYNSRPVAASRRLAARTRAARALPPRLRRRTPTVHPLEALPAIVLTPLALAALVGWPFALAAVAISRGDRLLGAVALTIAMLWTAGIVKEGRLLLGMLLAWPLAVWSAIQQWRGRVDTEDLEDGRFVPLAEHRELDPAERATLEVLAGSTGIPELQRQAEEAKVIAECLCGCASIRLLSHAPAIPRAAAGEDAVERLEVEAVGHRPTVARCSYGCEWRWARCASWR